MNYLLLRVIIQSMSFCLGLPLPLFPSILPSINSLCRELPLRMCPIQFFCLVLIISIKDLFSSTLFNTSSFVLGSFQLILSILLNKDSLYEVLWPLSHAVYILAKLG